jgi:hypothetical protein
MQAVQSALRSSLAHIRHSRIAPSAIDAPLPGFLPPSLGITLPAESEAQETKKTGLQEARVERDAWNGILDALKRLKLELSASADRMVVDSD